MAYKDKSKDVKKAKFEKVVALPLLPEHEAELVKIEADKEGLFEQIEVLLASGYSVQLDYDPNRAQYSCRITGEWESCPNAGSWLYGNSDTAWGAIGSALFKHFFIAEGGIWKGVGQSVRSRFS